MYAPPVDRLTRDSTDGVDSRRNRARSRTQCRWYRSAFNLGDAAKPVAATVEYLDELTRSDLPVSSCEEIDVPSALTLDGNGEIHHWFREKRVRTVRDVQYVFLAANE